MPPGRLRYLAAGGFQTRWGLIYRSDSLHLLTAEDLPAFDAPGCPVDLRPAPVNRAARPPWTARAHPRRTSQQRPDRHGQGQGLSSRLDGEEWLLGEYRTMLASAAISVGNLFTRLSQDTRLPAVIHCVGGKDRRPGSRATADRPRRRPRRCGAWSRCIRQSSRQRGARMARLTVLSAVRSGRERGGRSGHR
jgi:hypothetical protein